MDISPPSNSLRLALVAIPLIVGMLMLVGCGKAPLPYESAAAAAGSSACGGDDCHDEVIGAQAAGAHTDAGCVICHEGADGEHTKDPKGTVAATEWRIEGCSDCHEEEAATYLYDDNKQAGPFGGSITEPKQPKTATFPAYNKIVAGHGFTKEYNEEGAHRLMLQDHYEIKRGKFEVCMQCKSTKVALAFKDKRTLTVASDTEITLTHTATDKTPAKKVVIPRGTTVSYATDPKTHEVDVKVKMVNGKTFSSRPAASEDATANFNTTWAATVAATKETMPYGAGCNHCHDPHTAKPRLVRKAMLDAIAAGGKDGRGSVNPYAEDAA
ncbi:MAG: ammonia-forming cytochrome c nitrite reductase subunit c552, partial [Actinomycetota bacterium]|nr:ammonia-forming cytochrome c nitrite reductase subunit c552 [Actinomycetota bacterium]